MLMKVAIPLVLKVSEINNCCKRADFVECHANRYNHSISEAHKGVIIHSIQRKL